MNDGTLQQTNKFGQNVNPAKAMEAEGNQDNMFQQIIGKTLNHVKPAPLM